MADVRLTLQKMTLNKITPSYTGSLSVSDTYQVRNTGKSFVHLKKTGAGVCTVTVQTPGTVGGVAIAEHTFTVPATTGDVMAGPFPPSIFNDSSQDLNLTFDDITGLTVAAVSL